MENSFMFDALVFEFAKDLVLQKDYSVERAVHSALQMATAIKSNDKAC